MREYHYAITLQWTMGPRTSICGYQGVVAPGGSTRMEVFNWARAEAIKALNAPDSAVALFFSLEPNELAA